MRLFREDSPIMQTLTLVFDLVVLNVLVIVTSIPIITIGASATALYDAVWRLKNQCGNPFRDYFRAFRSNFKQATLLFIPFLCLFLFIGYALLMSFAKPHIIPAMVRTPLVICTIMWVMFTSWVFPLQSRFVNSWAHTITNAIICALRFFPRTIAMTAFNLLPWVFLILSPTFFLKLGSVWLLLWFGLAGYWNICLLGRPFRLLIESATPPEADDVPGKNSLEE